MSESKRFESQDSQANEAEREKQKVKASEDIEEWYDQLREEGYEPCAEECKHTACKVVKSHYFES